MLQKLKPYWQALPVIFNYQIITKALIGIWIYLLGRITQALLVSTGRVAITSGDFGFLFKTWQGYLILTSFAVLVFLSIGVANLFILHGIVIDKMSVKEAVTVQKELTERSDLQRIVDCIMTLVS